MSFTCSCLERRSIPKNLPNTWLRRFNRRASNAVQLGIFLLLSDTGIADLLAVAVEFLRKLLLVGASLVFMLGGTGGSSGYLVLSFCRIFLRSPRLWERRKGNRRRALFYLWCCLGIELAVLRFFKYFTSLKPIGSWLYRAWGACRRIQPNLFGYFLPIGISFYTFHAITLAVDTFRGTVDREVRCWMSLSTLRSFRS